MSELAEQRVLRGMRVGATALVGIAATTCIWMTVTYWGSTPQLAPECTGWRGAAADWVVWVGLVVLVGAIGLGVATRSSRREGGAARATYRLAVAAGVLALVAIVHAGAYDGNCVTN